MRFVICFFLLVFLCNGQSAFSQQDSILNGESENSHITSINGGYVQMSGPTYYYPVIQQDLDGSQTFSLVLTGGCTQPERIKVYPIPAQNNCWVSIQSERTHTLAMHLYNAKGALLKQQTVRVVTGYNVYELSLADYPRGIYSLVPTWNNGKVKAIKVEMIL